MLETVAAVPGMVGAMFTHLKCLRRMQDDRGWIRTLMEEAENERMHLMTFIEIAKPTWFERMVILSVQGAVPGRLFDPLSALRPDCASRGRLFRGRGGDQLYAVSARDRRGPLAQCARRRRSRGITGRWPMTRRSAMSCWSFATTRAHHRDVNHGFASTIAGTPIDRTNAPYPPHATELAVDG